MIGSMANRNLQHRKDAALVRLRHIVAHANKYGIKPTRLAKEAGLTPPTVNRKLRGTDASLIKPQTLAQLEEAAARLTGKPLGSSEALMAELDATNHEIAQSLNELVRVLIKRGVLKESDLPPALRDALRRRHMLLELLGHPTD